MLEDKLADHPTSEKATLGLFQRRTKITADRLGRALFMMAGKSAATTLPDYRKTLELETNGASEVEYILGLVYMIEIAVKKGLSPPVSDLVLEGARAEFLETMDRAGADRDQTNDLLKQRLDEYAAALAKESGAGPMFHLARIPTPGYGSNVGGAPRPLCCEHPSPDR